MTRKILAFSALALALAGCDQLDPNAKPKYGDTGLPVNCRAYVQAVVDGFRSRQYNAEQSMAGLERNCGLNGSAWGKN